MKGGEKELTLINVTKSRATLTIRCLFRRISLLLEKILHNETGKTLWIVLFSAIYM